MKNSSVDKVILQLLSTEHAHLNPQQIFNEIRGQLPAVNQSTVYRSLDRLVKQGKVSVSDMGTGAAVYELVSDHLHHHLICQNCGAVVTIENDDVQKLFNKLSETKQFTITTNHLVLFGLCHNCQIEK